MTKEPTLEECLTVLHYVSQPTMGYIPTEDIYSFIMRDADAYKVRLALLTCVLMARNTLRE